MPSLIILVHIGILTQQECKTFQKPIILWKTDGIKAYLINFN